MSKAQNVDIKLAFPLSDGGQVIDKLSMRRPKVRDMLGGAQAGGSDAEAEVRLFAGLCDITPELVEGMDLLDYQALQDAYKGFLS